jgi:hypothetical protein
MTAWDWTSELINSSILREHRRARMDDVYTLLLS